ncbi:MAG: [FeFe] hydrogenase H-cluster maturation GTPase HydF [Lachnospiraceae bacterium]|nr:[FeFe] hydrogenase H-cluster maturation GTPase HydF [Lachnospiraceae bacterium]
MSLNQTPSANRLHIGIFGKVNSGKSTLINAFTGQDVSIVSDIAGTTTDVVTKAMEIAPLGPCVLIDTAGFDDTTMLGEARKEKTRLAAEKCDIAVLLFAETSINVTAEDDLSYEKEWYSYFVKNKIPVLAVVNKTDLSGENIYAENIHAENSQVNNNLIEEIKKITKEEPVIINAKSGMGIDSLKEALVRKTPEDFETGFITGNLIKEDDVVMLVMPQDAQAPKGRLILPQVQTIRELLDRKCVVMSVTPDKMSQALEQLKNPPKLIITDSQVFKAVFELKPEESMLTSFSVLFAAYKGDLLYYIEGAKAIDRLTETSKVLIAECCTHAPLSEDIGRVKIPNMLRKRFGKGLFVDVVSGTDFPKDLREYDLIIQCGGCMFNRRYVLSRVNRAKEQAVPMTNYGVTIAHMTGILDDISYS